MLWPWCLRGWQIIASCVVVFLVCAFQGGLDDKVRAGVSSSMSSMASFSKSEATWKRTVGARPPGSIHEVGLGWGDGCDCRPVSSQI